ncbi:MAG: glycosyltransferase family 1 protein [Nitrospiraceae bacterium]|nr:glycosyltransferase family 1 protein [Nitrospiraceae bacterium]
MRILHLGNPYFVQELRQLGHDVKWAAHDRAADLPLRRPLESVQELLSRIEPAWSPDFVLLGDDSTQPVVLKLESLPVPLVWYAIDSHLHANWHQHYASVFDVIFVAQRDWERLYRADPDRQTVMWQPLFCRSQDDYRLGLVRDLPLSFIGTLNQSWNPRRVELIQQIQARYPIVIESGSYLTTFNRSMVVLNQSAAGDVNFRTFQAMACGALLLSERVENGFGALFQDGVHCALYDSGNVEQVIELTEHYRSHADERAAVAERGYQAVMAAHTSLHRAQAIVDAVVSGTISVAVSKRAGRQLQIQWSLASVYESSARKFLQAAQRMTEESKRRYFCGVAEQYQFLATTIRRQLAPLLAA